MTKNKNPTERPLSKEEKKAYIEFIISYARLICRVYPKAKDIRFVRKESED